MEINSKHNQSSILSANKKSTDFHYFGLKMSQYCQGMHVSTHMSSASVTVLGMLYDELSRFLAHFCHTLTLFNQTYHNEKFTDFH